PQAIAARHLRAEEERDRLLSLKMVVGKIGLTLLGLLCGASISREGPTVQVGASIMLQVARWGGMSQARGLILAGSAAGVAAAFGATGKALDGAMTDLKASAETAVTQLNNLSASLAKVNAGLARANEGTAGQAALLDQRDQMLEQMSALTDVTVSFDT
ncbi:chloride channel protein, partial [Proteus mirabilis]|uniref:chloride channel protein n=1 Tax=Proteus mirabilis TaxID=584 RepID=UPI0019546360